MKSLKILQQGLNDLQQSSRDFAYFFVTRAQNLTDIMQKPLQGQDDKLKNK